jgi:ABC-type transport system involved in multi-copper enzyme maturation permease subunit
MMRGVMVWLLFRLYRRSTIAWLVVSMIMAAAFVAVWWVNSAAIAHPDVQSCLRILTTSPESDSTPAAQCSVGALASLDNFRGANTWITVAIVAMPLLLGMFMAAPLMGRELENGTHRLIWTQSITPLQWLLVRVACSLALAMAMVVIVTAAVIPWLSLGHNVWAGSPWPGFDLTMVAVFGYGLFAVMLGLAAATVIGRTVASMAVTGVVWVATRTIIEVLLRPNLVQPQLQRGMSAGSAGANWYLSVTYVDRAGHVISFAEANRITQGGTLLQDHGISPAGLYQPADRFWTFQGTEAVIFAGLAVLCGVIAIAWVKFRLASQ